MAKAAILVADDDRVVVELLSLWLDSDGFNVVGAADGMQVTMAVRRAPPVAILLDLMMPGGTGFDVMKRLHANSGMRQIPVIAMSANVDSDLPHKAREAGAVAFLYKPLAREELVATLRRVLGLQQGQPQGRR